MNILVILLVILQLIDLFSTLYVIHTGIGYESNKFLSKLASFAGKTGMNIVLPVLKGLFIFFIFKERNVIPEQVFALLSIAYTFVAWNNLNIIRKAKNGR